MQNVVRTLGLFSELSKIDLVSRCLRVVRLRHKKIQWLQIQTCEIILIILISNFQLSDSLYSQRHNVFLYHIGPVMLFFGHHFRDLLIPNFMVVMILISFNHILLNLDSFDFYCGSLIIYRVAFLVVSGAVQAIQHILRLHLFTAILLNRNFARKNIFFSTL